MVREHPVRDNRWTRVTRRTFLGSLAALAAAPRGFAQEDGVVPVSAINHVTLGVSDPARSLEWYQGLFGLPIAARQADTVILRIGSGPQFLAIGGRSSDRPGINHLCLATVEDFSTDEVTNTLDRVIGRQVAAGEMSVRIRMRDDALGGAPEGTPELYVTDPDGLVIQLQDRAYCGGAGERGEVCAAPEPAPGDGLLTLLEYNHVTIVVTDPARSIALYQQLFGLPIDTYQGALPVLRIGEAQQFLALAGGGGGSREPAIHHVCLSVADFEVDRIVGILEDYGVTPRDERATGPAGPLESYVTMRMPDRGGDPSGTPELYVTDPDGILIQLQDAGYCGGSGYLGDECGTPDSPTGRNA